MNIIVEKVKSKHEPVPGEFTGLRAAHDRFTGGARAESVPYYESAVRLHPNRADLWQNLSVALSFRPGAQAGAIACARRAVALSPNNPELSRNLGSILHHAEQYSEAKRWLEKSYAEAPGAWMASFDLGILANAEGEYETAIAHMERAIALGPDDDRLRRALTMCIAHAKMGLGDYVKGLELYENRWIEVLKSQVWSLGAPEWQGEDLTDKHLMVHHDQGDGDTLQFCRYLPFIKAGKVSIVVPQRLMRAMRSLSNRSSAAFIEVLDIAGDLPTPDYHSAVCSYLRFINQPLPSWHGPYLHASGGLLDLPPMPWPQSGLKIGLVWAARRTEEAVFRAIPLAELMPLVAIPGVHLYSFQIDREGSAELQSSWASIFIKDFRGDIRDWQDTANLMSQMDLIVSVDSGPLHMAGALGKPLVALIPYRTCWRWGGRLADTTPWYPTMTILRQKVPNVWSDPVQELCDIVRARLAYDQRQIAA